LLRALLTNFREGDTVQGGSTITQQLVKILFLTPERSYERKFRELGGAWTLERRLSKDQILELYLNRIYLGSGAYGVDGAARIYFGKSAREVTLSEAAMLAALTRSPSVFSPRRDLEAAQKRAGLVLNAMVTTGAISEVEAQEASATPATIADSDEAMARNFFFDAAAEEVRRILPSVQGDLTVTTTFDPRMQEAARKAVETVMAKRGKSMRASQAALVSMSPDGALRAMIGGRDYSDSQFNRVTQAKRQPGSAFKAFVYLAALEHGLTPWTVRDDGVVAIDGYAPGNFDNRHFGQVTLKEALTRSLNTVAIKLQQEVGVRAVTRTAHDLGITSPLTQYASLALGTSEVSPLEITAAYAAFPAGGYRVEPYSVLEVRKPTGEVLYRRRPPQPERVVAENRVLTMNAMLNEVVLYGTARGAQLPKHEVAGKTGTSSEFRDAWFIGYTTELVTGVWVGNDDFTPMRRVTGGSLPAQIWKGYMTVAMEPYAPKPIPKMLPPPETSFDYVSYSGDSLSPEQNESNGFFIDVPGFLRDMFSPRTDRDGARTRDADRQASQEEDRQAAQGRRRAEIDRNAREYYRELRERRERESQEFATVRPPRGYDTYEPPLREPEPLREPAPSIREIPPIPDMPPVGDLEAQRRTLAERELARQRMGYADAPPPSRFNDPYAERDAIERAPYRQPPRFERRPPPELPPPDAYEPEPGYMEEEPPPMPPPDPWFSMPWR
jgi:penicillin-binding protein 1A